MNRRLIIPPELENRKIKDCYECPFYDGGDSGYGEHCNLLDEEQFMEDKRMYEPKGYMDEHKTFREYCPLPVWGGKGYHDVEEFYRGDYDDT